jgi:hypothetical protein
MVYRIRPIASHLNHEIDLDYQQSPAAQGSWFQFVKNEKPIPKNTRPPSFFLSEQRRCPTHSRSAVISGAFRLGRER